MKKAFHISSLWKNSIIFTILNYFWNMLYWTLQTSVQFSKCSRVTTKRFFYFYCFSPGNNIQRYKISQKWKSRFAKFLPGYCWEMRNVRNKSWSAVYLTLIRWLKYNFLVFFRTVWGQNSVIATKREVSFLRKKGLLDPKNS